MFHFSFDKLRAGVTGLFSFLACLLEVHFGMILSHVPFFFPLQNKKETECRGLSSKLQCTEAGKTRLERDVNMMMERESKRVTGHEREIKQAADMNAKLRQQLLDKEEDSKKHQSNFTAEVRVVYRLNH